MQIYEELLQLIDDLKEEIEYLEHTLLDAKDEYIEAVTEEVDEDEEATEFYEDIKDLLEEDEDSFFDLDFEEDD
jgi:DNA helicase IV